MAMHIEIQSRKFIKPATPTPSTLRHYKISSLDEIAPGLNISVALFFSVDINHSKFVSQLENSLEKTLPRFYPLAGRYLPEISVVDCSDQGVEFKHAKTNINLKQILDPEVNLRLVNELMPSEMGAADQETDPILSIQLTTFECGGVALGVSVTHRIVDASSLCTFLNQWASLNLHENDAEIVDWPGFNSPSFFPPRGLPSVNLGLPRSRSESKFVTKKLSFSDNDVSKLKEKLVTLNGIERWSKLQIVCTLICHILIGLDRRTLGYPRDSVLLQPINLRGKTETLIPKDSCGNLCGLLATECKSSVETTQALADVIRDSVKNTVQCYSKLRLENEEAQKMVLNSLSYLATIPHTKNVIWLNSWCRFPFYEADFGFGKPIWVNCGSMPAKNSAFLIDGVGGNGVEAYVGLEQADLSYFQEAIKAFAV